ncbi:MAG: ABC transporter ATP-binding protein [Candidatus Saccharimonadales bacterium]
MDTAIATKQLSKSYGKGQSRFDALTDINLAIGAGESVAILGKSGSGKSTLMHLLALLDKPTTGTIKLGDVDAHQLSTRKLDDLRNKSFGFVFQQFFLNGNDSVLNNVILPLKIAGIGRKQRRQRGLAALRAVDLDDKAQSKAVNLSGGQKQRACIARALISEPSIIFADEPTGNLDSATGAKIENLLFELNQKQGITLIIVTHDQDLAKRCQRQLHIKDGRLQTGSAI